MSFLYSAFGLTLRSNLSISGLTPLVSSCDPDVELHLGVSPASTGLVPLEPAEIFYTSSETNHLGAPLVRIWRIASGSFFRVEFDDGAHFWLSRHAATVWAIWQPPLSLDDALSYLLGPILGFVLRLRGVVCLHASAVSLGDGAVAFVGPAGSGKSTAAAALAARGYASVSDDIVALIERDAAFHVLPAYPHLCLWPDSVNAIFGSPDAAPPFSPNWEKRRLQLGHPHLRFETRSIPLLAIYILSEPGSDAGSSAQPLSPRNAFLALVANSYATNALDPDARAKELEVLGRLLTSVPVRVVGAHPDAGHLAELCESISAHRRVGSSTGAAAGVA